MDDIRRINNSIILVDEDSSFLRSKDFARMIRKSTDYFLLITRDYLPEIPYSVEEIYEVTGKKKKKFIHSYENVENIYAKPHIPRFPFEPDIVITEDSNSGYQFFQNVC